MYGPQKAKFKRWSVYSSFLIDRGPVQNPNVALLIERSTFVGQRPMKSLSYVCPSVRPSVTKFTQDWIISFFLILYMMIADHDVWWLTEPDFWKKKQKNWQPEFGLNGSKSDSKLVFLRFLQVWFISFPWNCIQW